MKNLERKQDIRKELFKKRNTLTKEDCEKYSKLIEQQLFSLEQYMNADTLLIYASYQKEVSTYGIIEKSLSVGKQIFCPKVLGPGTMEFYKITSLNDIICGYKNIPEPITTDFPYQDTDHSRTLMVMPLVGFDKKRNRLGYGGGFYDRYLQKFPNMERLAIGFECQRSNFDIPVEITDQKPNRIITENSIY